MMRSMNAPFTVALKSNRRTSRSAPERVQTVRIFGVKYVRQHRTTNCKDYRAESQTGESNQL